MNCTGCAEAIALGLARCLPCARKLAGRRDEPSAKRRRMGRQTFRCLRR